MEKWPSVVVASADVLATEEVSMKFRESKDEPAPVPLIEPMPVNEGDVDCPRESVDCSEPCRPLFGLPAILLRCDKKKSALPARAVPFLFCSLSFPSLAHENRVVAISLVKARALSVVVERLPTNGCPTQHNGKCY